MVGAAVIILARCVVANIGAGEMFGPEAFVIFLPLVLFWAGAWLRRSHRAVSWAMVGCLLAFSVGVGLLGATDPCPREGYERYTVAQALTNLVQADAVRENSVFAGR